MKFALACLVAFVLLLFFGPGCGGGGGAGGNGGGGGNISFYVVEATKNGVIIDPLNVVLGETVQFDVVGYTATGVRQVQNSSNWTADPTGQGEGTMSPSGTYTSSASGPQFTVQADANQQVYTGVAQVKPAGLALVAGRLIDGYGHNARTIFVDFYDASNNLVGSSQAQADGSFRAAVPTSATGFDIRRASIPAGYYREYQFNGKWYLPKPSACIAPLPALTAGITTTLSNILVPATTDGNGNGAPPPPPPSACP